MDANTGTLKQRYVMVYHDGNGNIDKPNLIEVKEMSDEDIYDTQGLHWDEDGNIVCFFPVEFLKGKL